MRFTNHIFYTVLFGLLVVKSSSFQTFSINTRLPFTPCSRNKLSQINSSHDDNNNNIQQITEYLGIQHKYHHHITDQPSEKPNSQPSLITNRRQWIHGSLATAGAIASTSTASCATASETETETTTIIERTYERTEDKTTKKQLWNDPSCDPTISVLRNPVNDHMVYILGTAHISEESAQLAGELVRYVRPEGVFIELDAKRVGSIVNKIPQMKSGPKVEEGSSGIVPSTASASTLPGSDAVTPVVSKSAASSSNNSNNSGPFNIQAKVMAAGQDAVRKSIKGLYGKLEAQGFSAGEEFSIAIKEGLKLNSTIILGDQDVDVTLRRLTEAFTRTDLRSLLNSESKFEQTMTQMLPPEKQDAIVASVSGNNAKDDTFDAKELSTFVETMKTKDNVKTLMGALSDAAPELYQALVAERDFYMANGINQLGGAKSGPEGFPKTVAVMGIAHLDGVERNLRSFGWIDVNKPILCKSY